MLRAFLGPRWLPRRSLRKSFMLAVAKLAHSLRGHGEAVLTAQSSRLVSIESMDAYFFERRERWASELVICAWALISPWLNSFQPSRRGFGGRQSPLAAALGA